MHIWVLNNFARVTTEPKKPISRLDLAKTSYKDLVFVRGEFLRLVGAQNMSLTVIMLYYMIKYTFVFKTTLLESLRSQKTQLKAQFRQN